MARFKSPRVRVTLEQPNTDELLELTVQTDNRDMVGFDRYRMQKKWPGVGDAPFLWLTFLSWSALRRGGHLGDERYDSYEQRCVQLAQVDEDGQELDPRTQAGVPDAEGGADPTP